MTKKKESLIDDIIKETESKSILLDSTKFEHAQRVSQMLAKSTMVPEHFRNNIGNCVIALNLADRMKLDPFMVMQKMYVIHGKPGIEAQLAIAVINSSGKFTSIQYKMSKDNQECYAYAKNIQTGEECVGPTISIKMAKDEGWYDKKGSKWQTLPELMLRYRAAVFFGRLYCPEALLGMEMKDEIEDYGKDIEKEIEHKANTKTLDIPIEVEQEEAITEELTEEEKQAIIHAEIEEANNPGF